MHMGNTNWIWCAKKYRDMKLGEEYVEGDMGQVRGENEGKHLSMYPCMKFSQIDIKMQIFKLLTDPQMLIIHTMQFKIL